MRDFLSDLRLATRSLAKHRGFAAGATLVLGLGMGVALLCLRFLDGAVWRPIAGVSRPTELVASRLSISYLAWRDLRPAVAAQGDVAAFGHRSFVVESGGGAGSESRLLFGTVATGNLWSVLGVEMAAGRGLTEADDAAGSRAVVVSYRLANDLAGSAMAALGKVVRLNGTPFEIVGVHGPAFRRLRMGSDRDVWITPHGWVAAVPTSFPATLSLERRSWGWLTPIARPAPGVSPQEFQAAARVAAAAQAKDYASETRDNFAEVLNFQSATSAALGEAPGGVVGAISAALVVAVIALLLLACANVAHLFSARVAARHREFATRFALGGGRWRVGSLLVAEAVVTAAAAGVAALALLAVGSRLLADVPLQGDLTLGSFGLSADGTSVAICAALSALVAVAVGLAPVLRVGRHAGRGLRGGTVSHEAALGGKASARGVVVQVALGFVLLSVSMLMGRAAADGMRRDVGYSPNGLLLAGYDLGLARTDPARALAAHDRVLEEVAKLPGVERVALSSVAPLSGSVSTETLEVGGYLPGPDEQLEAEIVPVGVGYFETLGVGVARGRAFADQDRDGAPLVAVINQAFAKRFFPGRDALGGTLEIVTGEMTVVGVVDDVRAHDFVEAPPPLLYLPLAQRPPAEKVFETYVFARFRRDADALGSLAVFDAAVRRALPGVPVYEIGPFSDRFEAKVSPQRFVAAALRFFGLLGLVLLASGIYAVVAHRVSLKRREIGLRAALGAAPAALERLFVVQGLRAVAGGLALGVPLAIGFGFALRGLLYGVHPADPVALSLGIAWVGATAALAAFVPARAAARVDPAKALKAED
jgi:putative ABC transport system permease protein